MLYFIIIFNVILPLLVKAEDEKIVMKRGLFGALTDKVVDTFVGSDVKNLVKFYLYQDAKNLAKYKQLYPEQEDSLRSISIPSGKTLNILTHGFQQNLNTNFPQELKDAILKSTGEPVICVDWGEMAVSKHGPGVLKTLSYPMVVQNVPLVGDYLGDFIISLKKVGVISSFDQVHMLGFSLGGHVSGIAGQTVQRKTSGEKVSRITGLDPAGPAFLLKNEYRRLSADSAKFVDVIHTSQLGYFVALGNVDFYPNGGKIQPGCVMESGGITDVAAKLGDLLSGSCSHARAWEYYKMSLENNSLTACECHNRLKSELVGCSTDCTKENKIPFGANTPRTAHGSYFLKLFGLLKLR